MTGTDERDLDLVRKSARELARRFDLGYWREKDKKAEYPWEFVKAFADAGWLGAMIWEPASAAPRWSWPPGTPTIASCSTVPSARTRRSRTRWPTRGWSSACRGRTDG
jgi:alkylation response protein AidB-like acyl-CoA dehydrogenase